MPGKSGLASAGGSRNSANMGTLPYEKCTACNRDSSLVTDSELQELIASSSGLEAGRARGMQPLEPIFTTRDFSEALEPHQPCGRSRRGGRPSSGDPHPNGVSDGDPLDAEYSRAPRNNFMAAKIDALAAES